MMPSQFEECYGAKESSSAWKGWDHRLTGPIPTGPAAFSWGWRMNQFPPNRLFGVRVNKDGEAV